ATVDNLTFKPYLQAIALPADGRIVIGGQFTHVGAVSRNRIVRLNADGSLDATFDPGQGPDKAITTVALQPDGKILVGGSFTNVANATRYYVARLNSDGSLDTTFNPNIALAYGGLLTVQVEADGKIFVAGDFAAIDGSSRNDIARLNPNGSLDTAFDPGTGPDTSSEVPRIRALAVQPDGHIVVGGAFATFNGVKLNYIARLLGDQGATVEFASASYSVDENGGTAIVAVRRTGSTTGTVSVNYASSDGTARAGTDYVGQAGWLVFGPGDTGKLISVPILPDSLIEGNETVNLTLGNPIGGEILGNQKTATLTIIDNTNSVANNPPTLAGIANQTVNEQTLLTFAVVATDPDGNTLTFSLVSGPAGVSLNPTTGVLTWTPTESQGPSTNLITVKVSDNGVPALSDSKGFTVVVTEANSAPVLTVPANQTIAELSTLVVTNTATDADLPANTLTFSLVSGPSGASVNPTTGVLTWSPTAAQGPSTNVITVKVTDNGVPALSDSK